MSQVVSQRQIGPRSDEWIRVWCQKWNFGKYLGRGGKLTAAGNPVPWKAPPREGWVAHRGAFWANLFPSWRLLTLIKVGELHLLLNTHDPKTKHERQKSCLKTFVWHFWRPEYDFHKNLVFNLYPKVQLAVSDLFTHKGTEMVEHHQYFLETGAKAAPSWVLIVSLPSFQVNSLPRPANQPTIHPVIPGPQPFDSF